MLAETIFTARSGQAFVEHPWLSLLSPCLPIPVLTSPLLPFPSVRPMAAC